MALVCSLKIFEVYLIKEIGDGLIIITASPGFIVRASREPEMINIDQDCKITGLRYFLPC